VVSFTRVHGITYQDIQGIAGYSRRDALHETRVPRPEQAAALIADFGLPTGNQEAEERLAGEGLIQALSSKSRIVGAKPVTPKAAGANAPLRGLERAKVSERAKEIGPS
jgi:hypothetical protein